MDIWHNWGGDFSLSPTGDLARVDSTEEGKQRVLRRLLTPTFDDIWDPLYGAGLPSKVGSTDGREQIEVIVRSQMLMEEIVSDDPLPVVETTGSQGTVRTLITYADRTSSAPVVVGFTERN